MLESRGCKQIAGNFKGFPDVMYFLTFASFEVCQNSINALYALYKPTKVNLKQIRSIEHMQRGNNMRAQESSFITL